MSNNFQMFQYDGSQYNQLIPNSSNTSINSTQLGGIESNLYATKEYVDRNKLQKYQVMAIPANAAEGKQIFKFDGISDFKYIQIYFYGAYASNINYFSMYIGGTYTEIIRNLNWYENVNYIIYGFVNGSNVLFNGFGGSPKNRYFNNLDFNSISKSTILSKGIEWNYTTEGTDESYIFHMVF